MIEKNKAEGKMMKAMEHWEGLVDLHADDGKLVGHGMLNGDGYWNFHVDAGGTRHYNQEAHVSLTTMVAEAGAIFNKAVA